MDLKFKILSVWIIFTELFRDAQIGSVGRALDWGSKGCL